MDYSINGMLFICIRKHIPKHIYTPLFNSSKDFKSFTGLPAEIHHAVCYINHCCAYTHLCHRQTHISNRVPWVRKHTHTSDIYIYMYTLCTHVLPHVNSDLRIDSCSYRVHIQGLLFLKHTYTQFLHQVVSVSVSALERDQCSLSSLRRTAISTVPALTQVLLLLLDESTEMNICMHMQI